MNISSVKDSEADFIHIKGDEMMTAKGKRDEIEMSFENHKQENNAHIRKNETSSESIFNDLYSKNSVRIFHEFDDPKVKNAADDLRIIERNFGEIDITSSMSKSSRAIDDLIDFKPHNMSKMNKPGGYPTSARRGSIDPLQYEKLKGSKEPEPLVIIPEMTPSQFAEDLQRKRRNSISYERPTLIKSDFNISSEFKRTPLNQRSETSKPSPIKESTDTYDDDIPRDSEKTEPVPEFISNKSNEDLQSKGKKSIDLDPSQILKGESNYQSLEKTIKDPSIHPIFEESIETTDVVEEVSQENKLIKTCLKGEWANVDILLRKYNKDNPIPNEKDEETGETVLTLACKDNRLVIVDRLLEMNVEVNERTKDGQTALHYASKYASEDLVKLLISKMADPHILGSNMKCLPIHLACGRTNALQVVTSLLKATKNARLQMDKEGAIPLMYALEEGSITTVKELLKFDTELQTNAKKKFSGEAAIHIACQKKDLESLRLLCEADAPINIQNALGQTALHICAEGNDEPILKYLYTNKANPHILDNMDRSALHMAAEKGHTKIVEFLIDKFKCNVLTRDKEGNTLMHVTSLSGHPETTMSFLKRGVPLHMPNKTGSVCLHAASQSGHVNVVRALLDKGANVNVRTKDLYTPLHIAVKYGNPGVVETLIGYGADANVKGGLLDESPLHIAAMLKGGEKCAEMLLKSGANVNDTMKKGETALHIASRTGNLEMLKSLLKEGANPIITCNEGNSPLHISIRYCHYPIVQELINFINRTKSRMDVTLLINLQNNEGETPLHFAAELEKKRAHSNFEDTDIIKILLEYDGDMKIQTKFTEETPLHYCAQAGNSDILLEIVNFLEHKLQFSINKPAKNGWSPLLFASENGQKDIVNILLKHNARVDVFDEHGMTALHLAAEKGHINVAKVLLSHKAFVNAKSKGGLTPLHLAAQNGFKELVEMLIEKHNATIDALTLNRKTPLHLAAQHGKKDVCRSLLYDKTCPADPNAADSKGQTPLHLAARNDHSDVVRLFLRFNPDLLLKANYDGMTCGHIAAANGCLAVIKEFMKFNISIIHGLKNKSTGSTSLHLAAEGGHYKVVKVLLEAGANPSEENNDGMTCLHLAAKYGHIQLLNCLKQKMSLRVVSLKSGMTPLHVAAHYGQIDFVREMLVAVPANIKSERPKTGEQMKDVLTESGYTPLHLASQSGHEILVRLLLNCSGVDVNSSTLNNGTIPLHFAAQNGHTNVTSLLLSKSTAQVTKKDFKGRTALHFAVSHGHLEMAALFISQGAEINSTDNMEFTPLHYAAKSGYLKVCKLLVEAGATTEAETHDFKIPLHFAAHNNHAEVVSFLLRNNYSTLKLLEDHEFLFDIMICSKLNNFKSLEEFILLSPAPAETSAKLAYEYREMSEKEKERSKDLLNMSEHCESICTDLVALAAIDMGADKLLKSIDNRGVPFLDILIETEQKEVISHPSVQRYLSDLWMGNLNWPIWKFLILFIFLLMFPLSWLIALLPAGRRIFRSPVLKYLVYLISHLYLTALLLYVTLFDKYPCYRQSPDPFWYEWLLLISLSGLLVSELINPIDLKSIAICKYAILAFGCTAIIIHIFSTFITSPSLQELIYIRNQLLSGAVLMCCIVTLDFLSIHHLFGPWTIIIRDLMTDLFRFLVILIIFLFSFACLLIATFQPSVVGSDVSKIPLIWSKVVLLYFSLFGQGVPPDLPDSSVTPGYSIYLARAIYGVSLMITVIVLINLLIAMMADTYENIQEESDKEWKFGRSKLIRNMKKTTPLPSPFILLYQLVLYASKFYYAVKKKPAIIYLEEKNIELDQSFRRKSQISPNFLEDSFNADAPTDAIHDVVNWPVIVRRYLAIRTVESEGESLTPEDFPEESFQRG